MRRDQYAGQGKLAPTIVDVYRLTTLYADVHDSLRDLPVVPIGVIGCVLI